VSLKRPKNLLLDDVALDIAEDYCARVGTTLSRVVEDYLRSLANPERVVTSPIVKRLVGAAIMGSGEPGFDTYRDYLYGFVIEGDVASIL
jgi:hypothetical protein